MDFIRIQPTLRPAPSLPAGCGGEEQWRRPSKQWRPRPSPAQRLFISLVSQLLPHTPLYRDDMRLFMSLFATHREVLNELINLHWKTSLGGTLPAYDGRKCLYTAGSLPFESEEFVCKLVDPERRIKKGCKRSARSQFELLGEQICTTFSSFCAEDRGICLKKPSKYLMLSSGSHRLATSQCPDPFSPPTLVTEETLVRDYECWRGYYQSLRPAQMGLSLNTDIPATSFFKPVTVVQFVEEFLDFRGTSRPLSDRDRVKIKKALQGVCIETNCQEDQIRRYKITGITSIPTSQLIFPVDNQGTRMTDV